MTLWAPPPQVREIKVALEALAKQRQQSAWRQTLASKRPIRAWLLLILSAGILLAVLAWRWHRAWEELEAGLPKTGTAGTVLPEARVPTDVMTKLVTHRVDPEYPAAAQSAKLEAVIALDVIIGSDGSVLEVRALNGPEVLANAAVEALRWWRFEPYRIAGRPVVVETRVAIEFKP